MDSDDPFLMPTDATLSDSVLLFFSHIFILLAIVNAIHRRLYYVGAAMSGMLINSLQFHMCRSNWSCGIYGTPLIYDSSSPALYRSRVVDHASANHAVVSLLFAVLTSDPAGGPMVGGQRLLLAIATFTVEFAFPLKQMALALALVCLFAVMSLYVWFSVKAQLPDASRFRLGLLSLALICLGAGYMFFELTSVRYGVAHSLWHAFVGLAIFLITEGIHEGRGGTSWFDWSCSTCRRRVMVI